MIAVLGTSFFMMAVAILWYSESLFLRPWLLSVGLSESDIEKAASHQKRNLMLTAVSYIVVVYLIARVVGYAQVNQLAIREISVYMALGFAALLLGFVVWEQRSFTYYAVTVGFSTVFIVGSTFFLYHWPW